MNGCRRIRRSFRSSLTCANWPRSVMACFFRPLSANVLCPSISRRLLCPFSFLNTTRVTRPKLPVPKNLISSKLSVENFIASPVCGFNGRSEFIRCMGPSSSDIIWRIEPSIASKPCMVKYEHRASPFALIVTGGIAPQNTVCKLAVDCWADFNSSSAGWSAGQAPASTLSFPIDAADRRTPVPMKLPSKYRHRDASDSLGSRVRGLKFSLMRLDSRPGEPMSLGLTSFWPSFSSLPWPFFFLGDLPTTTLPLVVHCTPPARSASLSLSRSSSEHVTFTAPDSIR
mmetsp:Transcript_21793/g.28217  ORF Transcript_21793/g.28217 Transcript_21793/m.28217 type:complete len:285 (-) Transcript_21793:1016-1870(-)